MAAETKTRKTGFRIKDILSDQYRDTSDEVEVLKSAKSFRKWVSGYPHEFRNSCNVSNSLTWLQIYWESLRQYYLALSVGVQAQTFQNAGNGHFSGFYPKTLTANPRISVNANKDGEKIDIMENRQLANASKLPFDSPLFELEKLASTRLSSWSSEFCPIKSLLEKKTSSQSRRRKSRTAFTAHQLAELEKVFRKQKYLTPSDRDRIAKFLNLSSPQVITWFQNRRAKYKRDLEEMQNDLLYAEKMKKKGVESRSDRKFIGDDGNESHEELLKT